MLVKDMFDKNGHNPSCGFAGDIVSYLYDEIDPAEKLKFESHLAGCQSCGPELAAFSNVRSSVIDWRTEEFGWLPSPQIVIPYEMAEEAPAVAEAAPRGTILTGFKRLFSFAPWPPAFAAFGALAILAGLAFFAFTYLNRGDNNLADNRNPVKTVPTVDPGKAPGKDEIAEANTNASNGVKTPEQAALPPKNIAPENGPQKISAVTTNAPKDKGLPAPKDTRTPNKPGDKNTTEKQKAPSLNNYADDEDTTLRLADLFEEIDTRE